MKIWATEIVAIKVATGELKTFAGQNVSALTFDLAQKWCDENMGYLKVIGELIIEIPCEGVTFNADFNSIIDYEKTQLN